MQEHQPSQYSEDGTDFANGKQGTNQGDFKTFKAAEKMAEEQMKQPGMDIDSIEIVPRAMWNAVEPKSKIPLDKPITAVLATYTGTEPCFDDVDCKRIIQNLQISQMEQKQLPDIQWNFMIGGTGQVYEGRGFDNLASKPPHYNKEALDSLDIAYIGNNEEEQLVPCMFASLNGLIATALERGFLTKPFAYLQDSPQYRRVLRLY
ncbi:peptidoglycan-recognition protein SB1-like [Macrosteles quadrilineatus]|uniref:peptidoglycan-recognition protein SB1-like n=1 Tax=Macrosteles quadrilineatus TaxID=74068 RepID=UPI0023E31912|nr:peptidoglycan-recognition protein SB1-like [Macrosteles quadrilineatus]